MEEQKENPGDILQQGCITETDRYNKRKNLEDILRLSQRVFYYCGGLRLQSLDFATVFA